METKDNKGRPYDLEIKAGQTFVLHDGKRVLLKSTVTKDIRYLTSWFSIVGTLAEVEGKVAELKLS
jgi:hypothetical protein